MSEFNLETFRAARDAATTKGEYWSCSTAELLATYATGERNFRQATLRQADLRWADLSEATLRGADLSGATLRRADLRGADLSEATLRRADLSGATLRRADLRWADLSEATLRGADLSEADLGFGAIANYWTLTRIGSDCAELQVAYTPKGDIRIKRGCSGWLSPDDFLARVKNTHDDNLYGKVYRATVEYIKARVALELVEEGAA